jgi:hypothetical protein
MRRRSSRSASYARTRHRRRGSARSAVPAPTQPPPSRAWRQPPPTASSAALIAVIAFRRQAIVDAGTVVSASPARAVWPRQATRPAAAPREHEQYTVVQYCSPPAGGLHPRPCTPAGAHAPPPRLGCVGCGEMAAAILCSEGE